MFVRHTVFPGCFWLNMIFSGVSNCLSCIFGPRYLEKRSGMARSEWFMNNALSNFRVQERKIGLYVVDLPF